MNKKIIVVFVLFLSRTISAQSPQLLGKKTERQPSNNQIYKPAVLPNISTAQGKTFEITLDSNRTTGYQWQLNKIDQNKIKFINKKYAAPKTKMMGASGKEIWQFKALKPGATALKFVYVRPWEKKLPIKPAKEVTYTVNIK